MSGELLGVYITGIVLVLVTGLYCLLVTTNLVRTIIGLELLSKGATLALALSGHLSGKTVLGQIFVVTLIALEVVIVATAQQEPDGAPGHRSRPGI